MSAEPASENDRTGLPRPMTRVQVGSCERRLPIPWINGKAGTQGDFYTFRADMARAVDERLCCVCGDPLGQLVTIAAANGRRETSAGWGHPRCVWLTVSLCPHFTAEGAQRWETVAWLYDGPGVGCPDPQFSDFDAVDHAATAIGRRELQVLSRDNPWGST